MDLPCLPYATSSFWHVPARVERGVERHDQESTGYDGLGRVVQVTEPDGSTIDTAYHGRQTATLDPLGHQTIQEVDPFGRLVSSKQFLGSYGKNPPTPNWTVGADASSSYSYNMRDQLELMTGPGGATSDPSYNVLGRKIQLVDSDMGTWQYRYDAVGNLAKQRDAKNQAICFYYDGHNRLVGKTYHSAADLTTLTCPDESYVVTYEYRCNGDGRRVRETTSGVTRVFIGAYFELQGATIKKYYHHGATRVAEDNGGTLYYLLSDHLRGRLQRPSPLSPTAIG